MKNIIVALVLISGWAMGKDFEDERLNTLYDRLQQLDYQKKQNLVPFADIVYLVGADGACQYSLIKDAINQANLSGNSNNYEIRVAYNKTYTENLVINRANLTLKGGYANCTDANNDIVTNTHTELDASSQILPAIIMSNFTTSQHNNNIYNFDISGGTGIASNPSGGINIRNYIEANIENSFIFSNEGLNGGGLHVEGDESTVFVKDTIFLLNDAINGGGLYCDGADVFVYGDSGISANNATGTSFNGSGGGVYLTNNCNFNLFSGTDGGLLDFRGIAGNKANRDGGGIYADLGAQVLLMGYLFIGEFGNNDEPVNITGNEANMSASTRLGGGIYAADSTTKITAYATIINNNETLSGTTSSAGAMYLFQADFSIGKLNSACWDEQKCNQISGNKVNGTNSSHAGIMALTGSEVDIKNTWVSGHTASSNVFLYGQAITATIEGNVFTGNGGPSIDGNTSLLSFFGDANGLSVAYNTFVNNEINTGLIHINNTPTLIVHGNIFKEDNNVNILDVGTGNTSSTQFNCLITHENQSFSGFSIFVDDPEFIDELNENFQLSPTSPAIDLCGDATYASTTKDLDNEDRAWDDLLTDNLNGAYDAGVDEFYPDTTADLSVSKTLLSTAPFFASESINYQIIVTNNGPDIASHVIIEDSPTGMIINTVQSANCSNFPCTIPSLNNGSSETINVTATLRSTEGPFDNSTTVYSLDFDPISSNNTDNTGNGGTVIIDSVDMTVSNFELITTAPYHSGQIITYQTTITNTGPDTARNVVIAQTTQSTNVQVINVTGTPCVQLPCNIASFPSGATVNLTLSVQIITGGDFRFAINVVTDSTDSNTSNNLGEVGTFTAQNTGDLEITAELITAPTYAQGQSLEISFEVTNNGPNIIGSIAVSASLNNLTINSVSGAGCTSLPCESLVLDDGDIITITVMATIINPGEFGLSTSVNSSNSFDPNNTNNTSSFTESAIATTIEIFMDSFE